MYLSPGTQDVVPLAVDDSNPSTIPLASSMTIRLSIDSSSTVAGGTYR